MLLLFDLRAQYAPIHQDVLTAITPVGDSQQFIVGCIAERLA